VIKLDSNTIDTISLSEVDGVVCEFLKHSNLQDSFNRWNYQPQNNKTRRSWI
jgi:hypothetical protein